MKYTMRPPTQMSEFFPSILQDRVTCFLILSKVGFLIAFVPVAYVSLGNHVPLSVLMFLLFVGAGTWGFSYGQIFALTAEQN